CARLNPGAAFFIGEVTSSEAFIGASGIRLFRLQVRVRERLFGLANDPSEVSVATPYLHLQLGGVYLFEAFRQGRELNAGLCSETGPADSTDAQRVIEYLRSVRDTPQMAGVINVQVVGGAEGATVTIDGPVQRQAVAKSWKTVFGKLPPGTYRVSASHEAYERDDKPPAEVVATVSALSCSEVRIPLVPKLRIAGLTVNAQGDPAPHVLLVLYRIDRGTSTAHAASDGQGRFAFPRLHPGKYRLSTAGKERVTFFNGKARLSEAALIDVRAGAPTEDLRMTLLDSGALRSVRIHAADEEGRALAGATIANYNSSGEYSSIGPPLRTDAEGMASVRLFEGAHYILRVDARLANGLSGRVWKDLPPGPGDLEIRVKIGPGFSAAP
ncbi:MAG: carboxypeptidase regulatory-like domain-containing protein, partial [Bryobacterales bacterium]|nr:carboxypeptidase regulatory-like domain-containing protein [Bryobacterales bacterium]